MNNTFKASLTGNTWPCHIVSGCVQTPRRSSTSARCRGHSRVPHDQLCHSYSNTALSPFWVPYSLWKYGHSCGNCSMLYLKQKKIINKLCRQSTNCTKCLQVLTRNVTIPKYHDTIILRYLKNKMKKWGKNEIVVHFKS